MHINQEKLGKLLSKREQEHLLACSDCREENEKLQALTECAENLPLLTPPKDAWYKIVTKQRQAESAQQNKKIIRFSIHWSIGIAASTILAVQTWLMWNNYQLQQQLEQVLFVNQSLEIKLLEANALTFSQTKLLSQVRAIELQLADAASAEEKLSLLKSRQKIMKAMLEVNQGEDYEYSI